MEKKSRRDILRSVGTLGTAGILGTAIGSQEAEAHHGVFTLDVDDAPDGDYRLPGMLHRAGMFFWRYGWRVEGDLDTNKRVLIRMELYRNGKRYDSTLFRAKGGFVKTMWTYKDDIEAIRLEQVGLFFD